MLSDSRILAYVIRDITRTFTQPKNRRELAHALRRVRKESGHRAAKLVLAQLSARCLLAK